MTFAATILTLYPEMFPGPLGTSLAGKALEQGDVFALRLNARAKAEASCGAQS